MIGWAGMRIYRLEVTVIDHDGLGGPAIIDTIENTKYPNHCIDPMVRSIQERDIGEWHDRHPLNLPEEADDEMGRLFGDPVGELPAERRAAGGEGRWAMPLAGGSSKTERATLRLLVAVARRILIYGSIEPYRQRELDLQLQAALSAASDMLEEDV